MTGRRAAESTLLTYRVVKQYRVRFVCKAKDPSKKITQNNLTSGMDQCVFANFSLNSVVSKTVYALCSVVRSANLKVM